jgi:hypothetical protein
MDSNTLKMPPMPTEYKKKFNEYMKIYRTNNRDSIKASQKKWVEAHKNDAEFISKQNKYALTYYHKNKESRLAPSRCECGGVISKQTKSTHIKTQIHTKYINSLAQQPIITDIISTADTIA